ncbi:hypothetical protein CMV_029603 [Castanea mollissima]|uniref:Uncharacterized protein n=1 Tax=Castanea mollissima TaxID=60419 RepID=A0A8J4Q5R7_9ROSI|nr:hypothetical protein CMV_029603 [Castanea mollissima]
MGFQFAIIVEDQTLDNFGSFGQNSTDAVQKLHIQSFLSLLVELANPFPYVVYCNELRKSIMVVWQNFQITLENMCFINIIFGDSMTDSSI